MSLVRQVISILSMIAVTKKIGQFEHAGNRGSFRAWLYQQARWRIADQFRARGRAGAHAQPLSHPMREGGHSLEKHFASWLGLCPDHRISGGKILGRSTRPVVSRARNALRLAAHTLQRSQTALGAKYRRLKSKLGAPKTIVAMAHHLARLIWRMMTEGTEFVETGLEVYEAKFRSQRIRWLKQQAKQFNMQLVELESVNSKN